MKRIGLIMICIFIMFGAVSCTKEEKSDDKVIQSNVDKSEENEALSFNSISVAELNDIIDSDDNKIIYFSRKTCERCVELDRNLQKVLDKQFQEKIYLFDTDKARSENEELMKSILNNIKVESVPTIIYFQGNNEKDRYDIIGSLDELKDWFSDKI